MEPGLVSQRRPEAIPEAASDSAASVPFSLDRQRDRWESRYVKSCGPSGSQDLAFLGRGRGRGSSHACERHEAYEHPRSEIEEREARRGEHPEHPGQRARGQVPERLSRGEQPERRSRGSRWARSRQRRGAVGNAGRARHRPRPKHGRRHRLRTRVGCQNCVHTRGSSRFAGRS
jgi:hypothetical protein